MGLSHFKLPKNQINRRINVHCVVGQYLMSIVKLIDRLDCLKSSKVKLLGIAHFFESNMPKGLSFFAKKSLSLLKIV